MIEHLGLIFGLIGAALSLASFLMRSMLPLRVIALTANVFFIAYAILDSNIVALLLHCALLPINAKRAWDIRRLIRDIETARSDTPVADWLLPHMTRREAKAGEVLWRRGEEATEMLYVHSGTLRLVEYGEALGAGALVGEIGLFSPDNRRTQSLECVTDCTLYSLTAAAMYQLYYQNPKLGFHIMRLVVGRLIRDAAAAQGPDARPGPARGELPAAVQPA
jgi:CRP/FNR family transcriptional regulator, cyclic AMP receptor protein